MRYNRFPKPKPPELIDKHALGSAALRALSEEEQQKTIATEEKINALRTSADRAAQRALGISGVEWEIDANGHYARTTLEGVPVRYCAGNRCLFRDTNPQDYTHIDKLSDLGRAIKDMQENDFDE